MSTRPNTCIDLRGPVIALILAATAVPVELKPPGGFGFTFQPLDFLVNIAGYVPVGFVLGGLPALRAVLIAAAISLFAEASQCVMMLRDPSIMDVVANVVGAAAGVATAARWKLQPRVLLRRWMAVAATVLAIALVAAVAATAAPGLNPRGATVPGMLEAHWTFDEPDGDAVLDGSGHGLRGTIRHDARRVPGMRGGAMEFNGVDNYIDFGQVVEFRSIGSLTVSAWIKVRANPVDDAAIVSDLHHVVSGTGDGYGTGFQLDTTVDRGPRTIGFKMGDACGSVFARYGATPLQLDTWYFVSGIYNAPARTVDVYLNGQLDNGPLSGTVPGSRRSSRAPLSVGRRSDSDRYGFAGLVDDVRVYSRALTHDEVVADMTGTGTSAIHDNAPLRFAPDLQCAWSVEPEEARIPVLVALLGLLVCVATLGLPGLGGPVLGLALSAAGGFLLFRIGTPTLPSFNAWLFPLTSVAAAVSVLASRRHVKT